MACSLRVLGPGFCGCKKSLESDLCVYRYIGQAYFVSGIEQNTINICVIMLYFKLMVRLDISNLKQTEVFGIIFVLFYLDLMVSKKNSV